MFLIKFFLKDPDLRIVGPFVGHVEGGLDGTAVGVEPVVEQLVVEGLVQVVDGVVKGEEDKLGDLLRRVASRDLLASAVAVLDVNYTKVQALQDFSPDLNDNIRWRGGEKFSSLIYEDLEKQRVANRS